MPVEPKLSARSRAGFRYSLRSAFAILCMFSVATAIWSNRIRNQNFLIREVERRGGFVWNVNFDERGAIYPPYPEWLPRQLYDFVPQHVNYIYLAGTETRDEDLNIVLRLPYLEGLNISSSEITDAGLKKLGRCAYLKELQLYDVETVSPKAIEDFQRAVPSCVVQR